MTGALAMPPKHTAERGRLVLVTMSLARSGGAEVQVGDLAIGLTKRGWDVEVAAMLDYPIPPMFGEAGVRTTCLHMRPGLLNPAKFVQFVKLIRDRRPDVVHSHMTHANLLARGARPFCPMPALVCTLHGYKMYSVRGGGYRFRELAHRMTDGLADATTVVCEAAAGRYRRNRAVSDERLLMVPNGIDTARYRADESARLRKRKELGLRDEFTWLAAGRLEPVKDYGTMLRAFVQAANSPVPQTLLIAGEGSQAEEMEALAGRLGAARRVRFLGYRDDLPGLMQAADAFVLSSLFEGLPLVLLEAGASGLPVVATRAGGNPEVLPEGAAALFVAPASPEELGRAMRKIATLDDARRTAMSEAARAFVRRRFDMEAVLDTWEALYGRLAARSRAARKVGA